MNNIDNSFNNSIIDYGTTECNKCNNPTPFSRCQRKNGEVYCRNCFNANRLAANKEAEAELEPKDSGVTHNNYNKKVKTGEWIAIDYDKPLNTLTIDKLHLHRQDNKKMTGPALLMEIFGYQLQIGKEKGYKDGSWRSYIDNNTDVTPSLRRHLIGVEANENDGWYTEYKPNGEACPTQANHAYALAWNAMVAAMQVYYRSKKNGR